MPTLFFTDDAGDERSLVINELFSEITIGRSTGNVIKVSWPSISRRHAKIVYSDGICILYDLGSSNGTWVNGSPVAEQVPRMLRHGDNIKCGDVEFRYLSMEYSQTGTVINQGASRQTNSKNQNNAQLPLYDGYKSEWEIHGSGGEVSCLDGSALVNNVGGWNWQSGEVLIELDEKDLLPLTGVSPSGAFFVQDCNKVDLGQGLVSKVAPAGLGAGEMKGGDLGPASWGTGGRQVDELNLGGDTGSGAGAGDGVPLGYGLAAPDGTGHGGHWQDGIESETLLVDKLMEQLVKVDSRLCQTERNLAGTVSKLDSLMLEVRQFQTQGDGIEQVKSLFEKKLSVLCSLEQVAKLNEKLSRLEDEISHLQKEREGLLAKVDRVESSLAYVAGQGAGNGIREETAHGVCRVDLDRTQVVENPVKGRGDGCREGEMDGTAAVQDVSEESGEGFFNRNTMLEKVITQLRRDMGQLEAENARLRNELQAKSSSLEEFEVRAKDIFDHMADRLRSLSRVGEIDHPGNNGES